MVFRQICIFIRHVDNLPYLYTFPITEIWPRPHLGNHFAGPFWKNAVFIIFILRRSDVDGYRMGIFFCVYYKYGAICSDKIHVQTARPCHIMSPDFVAEQHHLLHAGGAARRFACREAGTDGTIYVSISFYISINLYMYI